MALKCWFIQCDWIKKLTPHLSLSLLLMGKVSLLGRFLKKIYSFSISRKMQHTKVGCEIPYTTYNCNCQGLGFESPQPGLVQSSKCSSTALIPWKAKKRNGKYWGLSKIWNSWNSNTQQHNSWNGNWQKHLGELFGIVF